MGRQGTRNSVVPAGAAVMQPAARITARPGGAICGWQLGITHAL
jgi:hypothetical protein